MVVVVRVDGLEGDWIPVETQKREVLGYVSASVVAGGVTRLQVRIGGENYWVVVAQDRLIAASQQIASGLPSFKSKDFVNKERAIRAKKAADRRDAEMAAARAKLADGEGW